MHVAKVVVMWLRTERTETKLIFLTGLFIEDFVGEQELRYFLRPDLIEPWHFNTTGSATVTSIRICTIRDISVTLTIGEGLRIGSGIVEISNVLSQFSLKVFAKRVVGWWIIDPVAWIILMLLVLAPTCSVLIASTTIYRILVLAISIPLVTKWRCN